MTNVMFNKGLEVSKEFISPDVANKYLERNKANRPINKNFVLQYRDDMVNDKWLPNTQAIGFDVNGNLIDGQHRLQAIVEANKTVEFFVARNLPPESFAVIDAGKKRNAADVLGIEGFSYSSVIASLISIIYPYTTYGRMTGSVAAGRKAGKNNVNTNQEVIETAHRWSNILTTSAKFGNSTYNMCEPEKLFSKRLLGILHFFYAYQFDEASSIIKDLATGENLVRTDPIYAARRRFQEFQVKQQRPGFPDSLHIVIKAVNAKLQNQNMSHIKIGSKESFTQPLGLSGLDLLKFWDSVENQLKAKASN